MKRRFYPSRNLLWGVVFLGLLCPAAAWSETKIILANATYTMGEGETMVFAETMALKKAKQTALEQAGTYVESYTKVRNYDLTALETQTIAGGILSVEVLKTSRKLVGAGVQIAIKIKAMVSTDKMEELAARIRGKNVAQEYQKLQDKYAKLSQELVQWKQTLAASPAGPKREAALEQIQVRVKAFTQTEKQETAFFKRLVSGETLFSTAISQLTQKWNEKEQVEALFQKILAEGFEITMGKPTIKATLKDFDKVKVEITVPVEVAATEAIRTEMARVTQALGGEMVRGQYKQDYFKGTGNMYRLGHDAETLQHFQELTESLSFVLDLNSGGERIEGCIMRPNLGMVSVSPFYPILNVEPVKLAYHSYYNYGETFDFRFGTNSFFDGTVGEDEGFVVVLDEPIRFTLTTRIPLTDAKRITSVSGRVVPREDGLFECESSF